MKQLRSLNKYFKKYSSYFVGGILFTAIANLFAVISPVIIRGVIDSVQALLVEYRQLAHLSLAADMRAYIFDSVLWSGLLLLAFALLRGVFMFLMRQTIIVMSRKIEYDQKNEIYAHYQRLDTHFFKTHTTGDLMNRISEDVGRVRMYTGPAIMYFTNMAVITLMSIWGMLRINATLAGWVIAPLPLLAITIYTVNRRIYKKSADIQTQLSALTTTAQETFSGIRVIKSFAQEAYMISFFNRQSAHYKESAVQLSMTEAFYFPAMNLFIGLSLLSTIGIGGMAAIKGIITTGNIAEFVIYINLLIFPISSIGLVASMTQRAAASQKRIDDFLQTKPAIANVSNAITTPVEGAIVFNNVSFTYPHTGIKALSNFSLTINKGEKVAILGATGSGKSTLAHLLLRMYDPESGLLSFNGIASSQYDLQHLREAIAYTPQDAYLFSDTIYNNVKFGKENATKEDIIKVLQYAGIYNEIKNMPAGLDTVIGERGVMLSGGQKQRLVLARALLKNSPIWLFDECLSAVDTQTEHQILENLKHIIPHKTLLIITHRIFTTLPFDKIIVMDNGSILEHGTHASLLSANGYYAKLWQYQTEQREV